MRLIAARGRRAGTRSRRSARLSARTARSTCWRCSAPAARGITRRSFDSACARDRRGADPRPPGAPRCAAARGCARSTASSALRERVHAVLREVPARRQRSVQATIAAAASASTADRLVGAARGRRRRGASRSPRPRARARRATQRDQHDVEPHQPVLELGDHRGRRVAGDALPQPAVHRGDEVDDPGADRHAQRHDRGRRRMIGQRRRRGRERDRQRRRSARGRRATAPSSGG